MVCISELVYRLYLTFAFPGNFHAALIYRNDNEFKKVQKFSEKIVERALELDGTCTFRLRYI
jgi:hypothetical protein